MIQPDHIAQPERATQNRVIKLFQDQLGYDYLGNWQDRNNSNIENNLLTTYFNKTVYSDEEISRAIEKLQDITERYGDSLYNLNKDIYSLLRYGTEVKTDDGDAYKSIQFIDWKCPENNHFAIAEEVTLRGGYERRPDLVLYINGIAIGLIELKRSIVGLSEGIRQILSNQESRFNRWFFSTIQLTFAGNDSEGLEYGTIQTPRKYYLKWKEDEEDNEGYKLDKYLKKMCRKDRLIDLLHNFILFDGGVKKVPRVHQYFAVKAAQRHVQEKKGGIIWHTQGSGKSIVMVLLAQWILENNPMARVAIITDRDELDKQIERVFSDSGHDIYRAQSQRDLISRLGQATPRLLCSLVHKFGRREIETETDMQAFVEEMKGSHTTHGEVFVFVDECHRTQSGKLHQFMRALMPEAVYIGFTGTPLLKEDKKSSLEVFGDYIHTYKFNEAVEDNVVLDLQYEARDIEQHLSSQKKIDEWFEAKTKGLNDWQKQELKHCWGTMQAVLSSASRIERIVADIVHDFVVKPRLSSERGNAMLVTKNIFEASLFYETFQKTELKGKVGLITSYEPHQSHISKEEIGANSETDKQKIFRIYKGLLQEAGVPDTNTYEDNVKKKFINAPTHMKLVIVVDKLLTGFDAPPCTYLYIDKSMQDHGLFQAICRTNRIDGNDKNYGYIVDYMNLLKSMENSISVYTSELDDTAGSPEIILKDRLEQGRKRLDEALEMLESLCEPVEPPREDLQFIRFFCGNTENPEDLAEHEPKRTVLYSGVASLVRAYSAISGELSAAGYTNAEIDRIEERQNFYVNLRAVIKRASGEILDIKDYEADMRHLIDTYIKAEDSRKISNFDDNMGILELVTKLGVKEAVDHTFKGQLNINSPDEVIINNVRAKITREHINNPAFYEKMSALLNEIIKLRKEQALEYEAYLEQLKELTEQVEAGYDIKTPEQLKNNTSLRAIYENLGKLSIRDTEKDIELAQRLHDAVISNRPDQWRDNETKQDQVKASLYRELQDKEAVEAIFPIIYQQTDL